MSFYSIFVLNDFPEVYAVGHACSNGQLLVTERQLSVAIIYYVVSLIKFGFPDSLILILLFRRISELHSHIKKYILLHPACMPSKKYFVVHTSLVSVQVFNGLRVIWFHAVQYHQNLK